VEDIFRDRVNQLPQADRALLELLAVADSPLPLRVLPTSPDPKLFAQNLVQSETSSSSPLVRIGHPVVAAFLLDKISPTRKRELHGDAAKLLETWSKEGEGRVPQVLITRHLLQADRTETAGSYLLASLRSLYSIHGNQTAIDLLKLAQPLLGHKKQMGQLKEIRSLAADFYARVGKHVESLELLNQLLEYSNGDRPILMRRIADLQLKRRNLSAALQVVNDTRPLLRTLSEPILSQEKGRLLSIEQVTALLQNDFDRVHALANQIKKIKPAVPIRERALSLNTQGHVALQQRNWKKAKTFYEKALGVSEEGGYISGQSMALGSLGLLAEAKGDEKAAITFYKKAIEVAESAADILALATHYNNLGRLHETRGEYGPALRAYGRAIELYSRISNRSELAVALYRRALLHHFLVGSKNDDKELHKALDLAMKTEHNLNEAFCRAAIARYEETPEVAKKQLQKARAIFTKQNDVSGLLEIDLLHFEKGFNKDWQILSKKPLRLGQRVRLLAVLADLQTDVSKISSLLQATEDECRKHPNIEWLGQLLSIKAHVLKDRRMSAPASEAAQEALHCFERLSSHLDEELQSDYLSTRQRGMLLTLGEGESTEPPRAVQDQTFLSDLDSESASTSSLMVRRLPDVTLARFLELIKAINAQSEPEVVAAQLVDAALDLTKADRGFLVLREARDFKILVARNMDHLWIRESAQQFSRTVVQEVLRSGTSLTHASVLTSRKWKEKSSLIAAHTHAFLCAPVRTKGGLTGALYLDRVEDSPGFDDAQITIAEALGEQAAVVLERANLNNEIRRRGLRIEHLNQQLERTLNHAQSTIQKQDSELITTRAILDQQTHGQRLAEQFPEIVGVSEVIRKVQEMIESASISESPVYIFGHSGTGKELVARALHKQSGRKERPFVPVNCSAIPPDLFESSFFGHRKGAFTGAHKDHIGFFRMANGGTLFLDEVGDLPLAMQAKLLRVLQESKVRPVGGTEEYDVDARVVSASNKDLTSLVSTNHFREDLYYRLHVLRIDLPPLRERVEDIPLLAKHFLKLVSKKEKIPTPILSDDVLSLFLQYEWPGNVRQLKNQLERLVTMLPKKKKAQRVTVDMVQFPSDPNPATGSQLETIQDVYDRVARQMIRDALRRYKGNKSRVAETLGITRPGLRKMLIRLRISDA